MTGYYSNELEKHSRIVFNFLNETNKLYYNDTRNFCTLTIHITKKDFENAFNTLGPDILNTSVSYEEFFYRLKKYPNTKIGIALLYQKIICGIGNYLRCDILWYCKINYDRKIKLYDACINMIKYHANQSHSLNYMSKNNFFVYNQKEDIFGNKVNKIKINNRTIHYVDWESIDDDEIVVVKKKKEKVN